MNITTSPSCRVGWQGQTLTYLVRAEGASEIAVPSESREGLEIRVAGQRPAGDGVEAQIEVKVLDSSLV